MNKGKCERKHLTETEIIVQNFPIRTSIIIPAAVN